MITGWGSHHVDIAHWGMGTEFTGPIEIEGKAEFPKQGLWNVHGPYHIEAKYANGVTMIIDNNFTNGVRFEGADGWIFVSRGGGQGHRQRPGQRLRQGAGSQRPGDPQLEDRPQRNPPAQERRPPPRLAHQHPDPPAGGHHARGSAPLHQRLHPRLDRHEAGPQAPLGPGQGGLRRRRRGQRHAAPAPSAPPTASTACSRKHER